MMAKVFIVDDHPMMRKGICQAIAQQPHLTVVGEASTGAEVLSRAVEAAPDLLIMDIHLPDLNGSEVTRRLLDLLPAAKIIIFSSDGTRAVVDEALQAGAVGYIWKQSATDELIQAIDKVMAGKLYLSPDVSGDILEDYRKNLAGESIPARPLLAARDKKLLRLIAEGLRNKEIAADLGISAKSVEAYRSRLMKRLGCSSPAHLVRYAIREGIASA